MEVQRLQSLLAIDRSLEPAPAEAVRSAEVDFAGVLKQAIGQVEQDQMEVQKATTRLVTGQVTDIAEVMIASQRANLTLGMALQVRNKALEAYQEIMRMPL